MAKFSANSVLDAMLNKIATATALHLLDALPADRAAVLVGSLGTVAMDAADYTVADAAAGGREVTVAGQSVGVTVTGTVQHVALIDATELLFVTDLTTARAVIDGDTVNLAEWSVSVGDPA